MLRYGINIRKKYAIDFNCTNWFVFNQVTDTVVRAFNTRERARKYLRKIQKNIN